MEAPLRGSPTFRLTALAAIGVATTVPAQTLAASAVQQSATAPSNEAAAKALARKKRFEAIKRQLESGESDSGSSNDFDDPSPMRITSISPNVPTTKGNRTIDRFRVDYQLDQDLSEGFLEFVSTGSVTVRYPLPSLAHGRHTAYIPRGLSLPSEPVTFTCNLKNSHYSGVTLRMDSLWDDRDPDSVNPKFSEDEDASIYDYIAPAAREDRDDDPADDAAAFRGDEVGISGFNIPYKRNRLALATGRAPEIQIRGVNFDSGDEVVCSKPPAASMSPNRSHPTPSSSGSAARGNSHPHGYSPITSRSQCIFVPEPTHYKRAPLLE
jgi:hypothetical protein